MPDNWTDLEEIFHGEDGADFLPYRSWLEPLFSHHLWTTHDPIASELMVVDMDASIAVVWTPSD